MKVTQHPNYVIRVWDAENPEYKKVEILQPSGSRAALITVRSAFSVAVKCAVAMVDTLVESQKS
jgi:hypothetical protein